MTSNNTAFLSCKQKKTRTPLPVIRKRNRGAVQNDIRLQLTSEVRKTKMSISRALCLVRRDEPRTSPMQVRSVVGWARYWFLGQWTTAYVRARATLTSALDTLREVRDTEFQASMSDTDFYGACTGYSEVKCA